MAAQARESRFFVCAQFPGCCHPCCRSIAPEALVLPICLLDTALNGDESVEVPGTRRSK